MAVSSISAIEILDSRGGPALPVSASLADGKPVRSGVHGGIWTTDVAVGDSCRRQSSHAGAGHIVDGTVAQNLLRHSTDFADNR